MILVEILQLILLITMAVGVTSSGFDVKKFPNPNHIKKRINERYDGLFRKTTDGKACPHVCTVCDEFIMHEKDFAIVDLSKLEKCSDLFTWETNNVDTHEFPQLIADYSFPSDQAILYNVPWVQGMALSPR